MSKRNCAIAFGAMLALAMPAMAAPPAVPALHVPALHVVAQLAAPPGRWDYAAVDITTNRLFVARGDGVLAFDLASHAMIPQLVAGAHVHAVLPLPGRSVALATNGDSNTATLFATASGQKLATIATGAGPDGAAYDSATGLVLVMDGKAGDVTLIDPVAAQAVGSIAVGGKLEAAASDGLGHVFINVEDRAELAVIDMHTRQATSRIKLAGCVAPTGLAYDPASLRLVVACDNRVALVLRAADGAILAWLPIGAGPDAAMLDGLHHLVLIPCGEDGVLVAIRPGVNAAPAVAGRIATASGARTIAIDPRNGTVFLPHGTPPRAGQPGQFGVLVLAP